MFPLAAGRGGALGGRKAPKTKVLHAPERPGPPRTREPATKLTRPRRTGKFCQVAPEPAEKPELVRV
jgi:hypothetical protein